MNNRAAIVLKLLEMKDTIITKEGVFQVDSYTGDRRNELKNELYYLIDAGSTLKDSNEEVEPKTEGNE